VATVAINGARNAALLAVRIMALSDPRLAVELARYTQDLAEQVRDQDAELIARYKQG
jgi:5-(carboxyamino)imidazole ribonucleotide mutase